MNPQYPRPFHSQLLPNVSYMKVRTTESNSIGNVLVRLSKDKTETFPCDSIPSTLLNALPRFVSSTSNSFAFDLDEKTRIYGCLYHHSNLIALTNESNYAHARIQMIQIGNNDNNNTPLSILYNQIFLSSNVITSKKKRRKTPLKLPDVGIRYDLKHFDDSQLWRCDTCSLMNSIARELCAGCHSPKHHSTTVIDSSNVSWSCERTCYILCIRHVQIIYT